MATVSEILRNLADSRPEAIVLHNHALGIIKSFQRVDSMSVITEEQCPATNTYKAGGMSLSEDNFKHEIHRHYMQWEVIQDPLNEIYTISDTNSVMGYELWLSLREAGRTVQDLIVKAYKDHKKPSVGTLALYVDPKNRIVTFERVKPREVLQTTYEYPSFRIVDRTTCHFDEMQLNKFVSIEYHGCYVISDSKDMASSGPEGYIIRSEYPANIYYGSATTESVQDANARLCAALTTTGDYVRGDGVMVHKPSKGKYFVTLYQDRWSLCVDESASHRTLDSGSLFMPANHILHIISDRLAAEGHYSSRALYRALIETGKFEEQHGLLRWTKHANVYVVTMVDDTWCLLALDGGIDTVAHGKVSTDTAHDIAKILEAANNHFDNERLMLHVCVHTHRHGVDSDVFWARPVVDDDEAVARFLGYDFEEDMDEMVSVVPFSPPFMVYDPKDTEGDSDDDE